MERGFDSIESDRVEGFGPIKKKNVKRILLSLEDFQDSTHNMNGLVIGVFSTKSQLGGTNSGVEKMGKSFLNKRNEYFGYSNGQGDETIVREITGIILNFLISMTTSNIDQESRIAEGSKQ